MSASVEDRIKEKAVALCVESGKKPDNLIQSRPIDTMTPAELIRHKLTGGSDDILEPIMVPRWKTMRQQAVSAILGTSNGDLIARAVDAVSPTELDGFASHIGQDQWVAEVYDYKRDGFFLDFGTFDGVTISNTLYLERALGWRGICVEPNPVYYAQACSKRSAIMVNAALYERSREQLSFIDAHGISTFEHHADSDDWAERRRTKGRRIDVDTINPAELLERFQAPTDVDYMSLDVEGAELDVLKAFDFNRYKVGLLTIEHNHQQPKKQDVRDYLAQFGYEAMDFRNDDAFYLKGKTFPQNPEHMLGRVQGSFRIKD